MIISNLTVYNGLNAQNLFESKKDVFNWFNDPDSAADSRTSDSIRVLSTDDAYSKIGIEKSTEIVVHTMTIGYTGKKNENNKLFESSGKHILYDTTDIDGKYKILFVKDCTDPLNNRAPRYSFSGIFKRNGTTPSGMRVYTRISDTVCRDKFEYIVPENEE